MKKSSTQFVIAKVFGTVLVTLLIAFASCSSPVGQEGEGGINSLAQAKAAGNKAPRADFDIYDASDFQAFVAAVAQSPTGNVSADLMDDVDISGITFAPIGTADAPYTGDFDGGGYTLNIYVTGMESFLGLFGRNNGQIHDLRVTGSLTARYDGTNDINYVGGVVAYNDIYGTISRVVSNVTVRSLADEANAIGGIAGFNGWDEYGPDSPHKGEAYQPGGIIYQCRNEAQVTGGFSSIGGIVGENAYQVTECVNRGAIVCAKTEEGWPGVGGIVGRNGNADTESTIATETASILNSYNRGRVIGNSRTESGQDGYGCITGWNNELSSVENCYAVGNLTPERGQKNPIIGIGDLTSLIVTNNYSLNTLYPADEENLLTGIRMDDEDMRLPAFVDALNGPTTTDPYVIVIPGDYPSLIWESQFVVLAGD